MSISSSRLRYLLQRYSADECTRSELLELLKDIEETTDAGELVNAVQEVWAQQSGAMAPPAIDKEALYAEILHSASIRKTGRSIPRLLRISAAAAVILLVGSAALLYLDRPALPKIIAAKPVVKQDIAPGGNKAILTLADGSHIVLDSARNGALTQQGSSQLFKPDSGRLVYRLATSTAASPAAAAADPNGATAPEFNTVATPVGGQYQVTLADGTRVWLNALSSLRFPTAFRGNSRTVELSGEAYFEVAPQTAPFSVHVVARGKKALDIQVLGTHFNVNAYEDEPLVNTTLLEGKVKVSVGDSHKILAPGEQARVDKTGALRIVTDADTDEAIAWKNGYFQFTDADIPTVMRQLARWYDMQVTYDGPVPERQFGGQIQRSAYLSEVVQVLEAIKVRCTIDGKKVVISR